MDWLMLPSSRRWDFALSGLVRGRISEFREAHSKSVYPSLRSRE